MNNDYEKNGFVILKNIIPEKNLLNFNNGLKKLIKTSCEKEKIDTNDYFNDGYLSLDKINHEHIHNIYNILRYSNLLGQIIYSEKLASNIKSLMNLDISQPFYNMYNICRMDAPLDKKYILNWHQETYTTIPDTNSLQMWAPMINRNNKDNGSIDVLVGSHKEGVIPHYLEETTDGYKTFHLHENQISDMNKYERITVDLSPGDVLLFHPNLIHKSNYNTGKNVRYTLVAHFIDPLDVNFKFISNNEIIRLNRQRCINASEFEDLIKQEKQTYH